VERVTLGSLEGVNADVEHAYERAKAKDAA
jgi:hypothetical protein